MKGMGVGILGCLPGNVLLKDSILKGLDLAFSSNFSVSCSSPLISHEGSGRSVFSPVIQFRNMSYEHNKKAVTFDGARNITVTDCDFEGMKDGALFAVNSVIIISGSTVFTDNTGYCGGAIYLHHNNTLTLQDATSLMRNIAQYGGAVNVNESNTISLEDNVSLSSNSASAGEAIYAFVKNTISLRGNASPAGNSATTGGAVVLDHNNVITIRGFVKQ